MKNKFFHIFVTCILYVSLFSLFLYQYKVLADELENEVEDIQEYEQKYEDLIDNIEDSIETDGSDEDLQEEPGDSDKVLQDRYEPIMQVKATRSMTNTYTDQYPWLFQFNYYKTLKQLNVLYDDNGSNAEIKRYAFIFQKDKLPDFDLISTWVRASSTANLWEFEDPNVYVVLTAIDGYNVNSYNLKVAVGAYLEEYGYPDSNCYWEDLNPTPTPDPTDTPTPTPDPTGSPTPTPTNESINVMMVFCFGLIGGIIVGHFLTGFIK